MFLLRDLCVRQSVERYTVDSMMRLNNRTMHLGPNVELFVVLNIPLCTTRLCDKHKDTRRKDTPDATTRVLLSVRNRELVMRSTKNAAKHAEKDVCIPFNKRRVVVHQMNCTAPKNHTRSGWLAAVAAQAITN